MCIVRCIDAGSVFSTLNKLFSRKIKVLSTVTQYVCFIIVCIHNNLLIIIVTSRGKFVPITLVTIIVESKTLSLSRNFTSTLTLQAPSNLEISTQAILLS